MAWRQCINKGGCIYETFQAIRWLPVLIVIGASTWGYYAYVYELSIVTVDNWFQRIVYILGFHILLVLFVSSYFKTIFTPPGAPPAEFRFEGEALAEVMSCWDDQRKCQAVLQRYAQQRGLPLRVRGFDNGIRFCDKCNCIKPDRSHHCSMCDQCVLKFDHHCPWVNNCVNFSNYKFFLLFLGYGFTFCLWIFFTDLPYFIDFWQTEFNGRDMKVTGRFHLLFLVFVSGMFALSLSALFFYHLYLTAKNRSTVESFRAPLINGKYEKNAFNHGIKSNYREVFGTIRRYWILPVYTTIGTGADFAVSPHYVSSCGLENGQTEVQHQQISSQNPNPVQNGNQPDSGAEFVEISMERLDETRNSKLGDGVRFEKWTLAKALSAESSSGRIGSSIGSLRYKLLLQQEESGSPSTDVEMQTLYSDDEDEEVDLNVNVNATHV